MIRVGQGYDAHPRATGDRPLVLGGVTFDGEPGLAGHSDADVVAHAVTDALLHACGLGDIGQMFPDDEPSLAGADSVELLRQAAGRARSEGWRLLNADCTVIVDRPKISPVKDQMERRLSDAAGGPVTVSGKRTEGLGALGRGEGVVALAVALVEAV